MFRPQIATLWAGSYTYDRTISLEAANQIDDVISVPFEMRLTLHWFGKFDGTIVDGKYGVPEDAKINGCIVGLSIEFTKQYEHLWMVDEFGQLVAVRGEVPQSLCYSGCIRDDGSEIDGTWICPRALRIVNGEWYDLPVTTGKWNANVVRQDQTTGTPFDSRYPS